MIYFDNAATGGRKPDAVLTAVASAVKVSANPGRSGHKLSLSCANLVQDCRNELSDYFGGFGAERVAFTKNCTEALNIAILGTLKKGDHVVTTQMEHNSVLRPLEYLKKSGGISYDVCPLNEAGNISPAQFISLVKANTRLAIVTTASNVTGAIPPLEKIRSLLPKSVLFLCDGAQGCGHYDIKMEGAGIDLLAVAGHKGMLGIQGSGALLFSERVSPEPIMHGGTGSLSISLDAPDFYPDRLEAGTLSFPAILSLLEGTRHLKLHDKRLFARLSHLTAYALRGLKTLPAYRAYSAVNPCGIVAFSHSRLPSEYVAQLLSDEYDIAVRGGLHCAPLMHEGLGTLDGGLVRASFSAYTSEREIDKLIFALAAIE